MNTALSPRQRIIEHRDEFSSKQLAVARFLLDRDDVVAFQSVREVAAGAGVGPATVVRFCRSLGYSGFTEYQDDTRQRFLQHDTFVQRLRKRIDSGTFSGDLTGELASIHGGNIENTLGRVAHEDLELAVQAILDARSIRIFGGGLSASVAVAAEHSLSALGLQAKAVTGGGLVHMREVSGITSDDLVMAVSVWRYMRDTVGAAQVGSEVGAGVIALTDSAIAPVARFSDVVLVADTQGLLHSRSPVGLISVVHLLSVSVAAARPEESLEALERLDRSYRQNRVFWDE